MQAVIVQIEVQYAEAICCACILQKKWYLNLQYLCSLRLKTVSTDVWGFLGVLRFLRLLQWYISVL